MKLKCEYCSEEFESPRKRRYCFSEHYKACDVCGKENLIKDMKYIPQTCGATKCQVATKKTYKKNCEICGEEFEAKIPWGRFCPNQHYKNCDVCGKEFETSDYRPKTKTCSKKCAAAIVDFDARNAKLAKAMEAKYGQGITNASQAEEVKKKKKQTNLERRGVENPLQDPEIHAKAKATMVKKFGVDNPGKSPEIMARVRATTMKNYGVENPFQSKEIQEKIAATNLERYGHRNYWGSKEFQLTKANNSRRIPKTNRRWQKRILDELGLEFSFEEPFGKNRYADLGYGDILIDINPTITHNVSISYTCLVNGCDPNCEKPGHQAPSKTVHQERFLEAEADGKTLLQYFDWMDEEIFLSVLNAKLHRDEHRVGARQCEVKKISQADANRFLSENHLLGASSGQSFCVGLFYEEELVHVNTFGKARFNKTFEWEAIRSCSKRGWHVQGGLQRADAFFKKLEKPDSIVSYVDLALGSGEAEASNPGWKLITTNKPSSNWVNVAGGDDQPTIVKSSSARRVSADRLLGFEVGERYPKFHEDGSKVTNAEVLLSEGYLEVYGVGSRTFGWRAGNRE